MLLSMVKRSAPARCPAVVSGISPMLLFTARYRSTLFHVRIPAFVKEENSLITTLPVITWQKSRFVLCLIRMRQDKITRCIFPALPPREKSFGTFMCSPVPDNLLCIFWEHETFIHHMGAETAVPETVPTGGGDRRNAFREDVMIRCSRRFGDCQENGIKVVMRKHTMASSPRGI